MMQVLVPSTRRALSQVCPALQRWQENYRGASLTPHCNALFPAHGYTTAIHFINTSLIISRAAQHECSQQLSRGCGRVVHLHSMRAGAPAGELVHALVASRCQNLCASSGTTGMLIISNGCTCLCRSLSQQHRSGR